MSVRHLLKKTVMIAREGQKRRAGGLRWKRRMKKKQKYGKAENKKITIEEDGKIRKETETKKELAEIRQNLWRK